MYINPYLQKIKRVKDHEDRTGYLWLDMNENPEGLPEAFVKQTFDKINPLTISGYPHKDELIELIAEKEGLVPEAVTLTNGSDEGIKLMFETFTREGGKVVAVTPSFEMYRIYAEMKGVTLDAAAYDETFHVHVEDVINRIDENTNVVVLLNPNSPIGSEYSEDEYERIISRSQEVGALVFIDEAYVPFGVESQVSLTKQYDNVLILRTFSKLCSLAGLRVGYILGNPELIQYIENAEGSYNVNTIGILFATELLKNPEMLQRLADIQEQGKQYLCDQLMRHGYEYLGKYGNYVLIRTHRDPKEVAAKLREEKILIKIYHNQLLKGWVRITTGSSEVMRKFWDAFIKIETE